MVEDLVVNIRPGKLRISRVRCVRWETRMRAEKSKYSHVAIFIVQNRKSSVTTATATAANMPADIILDVAYDYYGRRVATCSSDNTIKIFDEEGRKVAAWKAHSGTIWRLSWAHPEFGVALASCSFDRKICIWEDTSDAEEAGTSAEGCAKIATWSRAAEIADARDSVVDIQFAPHHLGVKIASCSADGVVRVHEAPDVLDLASWDKHSELHATAAAADLSEGIPFSGGMSDLGYRSGQGSVHGGNTGSVHGGSAVGGSVSGIEVAEGRGIEPVCLAWCTNCEELPMLVVGMMDGGVLLWRYDVRAFYCPGKPR